MYIGISISGAATIFIIIIAAVIKNGWVNMRRGAMINIEAMETIRNIDFHLLISSHIISILCTCTSIILRFIYHAIVRNKLSVTIFRTLEYTIIPYKPH